MPDPNTNPAGATPKGAGFSNYIDLVSEGFSNIGAAAASNGVEKSSATGKAVGYAVGATVGTLLGGPLVGAAAGKLLGAVGGKVVGAGFRAEQQDRANRNRWSRNNQFIAQPVVNRFGNEYEDGGYVPEGGADSDVLGVEMVNPPKKRINIERNELMVDPTTLNVVRQFKNPNRYQKHSEDKSEEHPGNFVDLEPNHVIIPAKLATRYKSGDTLTRKSILMKILTDQANDPNYNVPESEKPVEQFKGGGLFEPGPVFKNGATKKSLLLPEMTDGIEIKSSEDYRTSVPDETIDAARLKIPVERTDVLEGDVSTKSKFNTGMLLRKTINKLPILEQIANTYQSDPYLREITNPEMDNAISLATQLPETIDVSGALATNNRSYSLALKGLRNINTPSARAEASALLSSKLAGDNSVYANKENISAQMKQTKLSSLIGLTVEKGKDIEAAEMNFMNESRMDKAARENIRSAGLTNLAQNELLAQNDDEAIKVINQITKTIDIDPYSKQLMNEDPNFFQFIFNYLRSGKGEYTQAVSAYLAQKAKQPETTTYEKVETGADGKQKTVTGKKVKG